MKRRTRFRFSHVRAFLFNHGEKVAAGLVTALVLAALVDTNWIPYGRQPEALLERIATARARLDAAAWPATERSKFIIDESRRPDAIVASSLYTTIHLADFAPSQPLRKRPGAVDRFVRQPVPEPVQELIASSERILIRLAPTTDPVPSDFGSETSAVPGGADTQPAPPLDEFRSPGRVPPTTIPAVMPETESNVSRQHASIRGHGYPYVAVRGIFDLRANALAWQSAMHCSYADALQRIMTLDFQLERQELVHGANDWSDWAPVDVQVFRDVAETADGFEPDVVSAQVTDSAITAPLLARITGVWRTQATHPRLAAFELSSEALKRESAFLKALVSRIDQQRRTKTAREIEKGGFTSLIRDARQLQQQLMPANSLSESSARRSRLGPALGGMQGPLPFDSELETLIRDVTRELDPREQDRHLREWIRARATAEGELLLFRYFDFNVTPGSTYRYRVRLELLNPNFGRSLAAAGGETDIVRTRTIWTPWSDATLPVPVAENVQYFLTRIEAARYGRSPLARMNMFQYDQELGSTVQHEIEVGLGQNIAGRAKVEQFDPAQAMVRVAEYSFLSNDVLVDLLPDLTFPAELHPDLALPPNSRNAAQLVESALVVNDRHDLTALNRVSQARGLADAQHTLELQSTLAERMVDTDGQPGEADGDLVDTYYRRLYGRPAPSPDAQSRHQAGPNVLQHRRSR